MFKVVNYLFYLQFLKNLFLVYKKLKNFLYKKIIIYKRTIHETEKTNEARIRNGN